MERNGKRPGVYSTPCGGKKGPCSIGSKTSSRKKRSGSHRPGRLRRKSARNCGARSPELTPPQCKNPRTARRTPGQVGGRLRGEGDLGMQSIFIRFLTQEDRVR